MNICTISTDTWAKSHLVRWVRYVRKNVKDAKLFLFYIGDEELLTRPLFAEFEKILPFESDKNNRHFLNACRMGATARFGVDEILYCDCDADVMQDLNHVAGESDKPLMCVKSPSPRMTYIKVMVDEGNGVPQKEMNNGLLYLRKDLESEYNQYWIKAGNTPAAMRIRGTIAFNLMVNDHPEWVHELPYKTSVIWWDIVKTVDADVIQYCNDQGQAKRLALEGEFRRCQ